MTKKTVVLNIFALALVVVMTAGCATTTRNTMFQEADQAAEQGDYEEAVATLEEAEEDIYTERDEVVYYLDTGILHHQAGNWEESIQRLGEAEQLIEEYFTKSVTQAAASFTVSDYMREYAGEDFEDIYLNVFRALSFLRENDPESALVEVRRIDNKLRLLEDKYRELAGELDQVEEVEDVEDPDGEVEVEDNAEVDVTGEVEFQTGDSNFHNSALARYLGMILRRADGDRDGARIEWEHLQDAFRTQESLYSFDNPLSRDSLEGAPDDMARVSVIGFHGQAPIKEAQRLEIRTHQDRISVSYLEEDDEGLGRIPQEYTEIPWPGVEAGHSFVFEIPRMRPRGSDVTSARVYADDERLGELEKLEDMEAIAQEAFRIQEPIIFVRALSRTIIKGLASSYAGDAMREAGGEFGLAGIIAGEIAAMGTQAAVESTEEADLRVSRYFPAYASVGEWDLEPGVYDLQIEYFAGDSHIYTDTFDDVQITESGPNVLSSFIYQ